MPDNKEHKIFSKEELFKLIDEKKSLPPEADDFDKEAMEGLAMLTDRKKLEGLHNSIDEVLRREARQAKKKRNIYILSAAASLVLIVGLFFLLKEDTFEKQNISLAENKEIFKPGAPKTVEETISDKKNLPVEANNTVAASSAETLTKEKQVERKISSEIKREDNRYAKADVTTVTPPAELANGAIGAGKDVAFRNEEEYAASEKKENAEKAEQFRDKEEYKTKHVTSAAPALMPASSSVTVNGDSKNSLENKNDAGDDGNGNQLNSYASGAENNAAATSQKNAEVTSLEKQAQNSPTKKAKARKKKTTEPDANVTEMIAGYSSYDKKPEQQPAQAPVVNNEAIDNIPPAENEKSNKQEVPSGVEVNRGLKSEPDHALKNNPTNETAGFIGGNDALEQFIKKNLKISSPQQHGIIVAEFLIKKNGRIDTSTIKINSPVKNCTACSKDVIDLVKAMPAWKPCSENGKASPCKQKLSVQYNGKSTDK